MTATASPNATRPARRPETACANSRRGTQRVGGSRSFQSMRPPRELIQHRLHARRETRLVDERPAVKEQIHEACAADVHGGSKRRHLLLDVSNTHLSLSAEISRGAVSYL